MRRNIDETIERIPAAALHVRGGAIAAANELAQRMLGETEAMIGSIFEPDRDAIAQVAAAAEASGAGTVGPVLIRLDPHPPHRFVEVTFGPHPDGGAIAVVVDVTERERLDAAIAEFATGVYLTDASLRATWIPHRVSESVGLPVGRFVGTDVYELLHPDDVEPTRRLIARAIENPGVRCSSTLRVHQFDQPEVWWPIVVHVIWRGDDPALGGVLVRFDLDLSAGLHLRGVEATAQGLITLAPSSATGALHLGVDGTLLQRSTRVREILRPLGDDGDQRWLELLRPEHRGDVFERLEAARAGELLPAIDVAFGDGTVVWARLDVVPYKDAHEEVAGMFVNLLDRTSELAARDELAAAREELWHLANHDALTGLANRRQLADRLDDRLPTAAVVCDLDRFKDVNDRFGHRVGDEVLAEAGRRIRAAVAGDDLVCRFGGDEFVVLCDGIGDEAALDALVARIGRCFSGPIQVDGHALDVGISVGGALAVAGDEADPDALILRADRAMYRAKAAAPPSMPPG
ncbi:MAG: diguanylate cyclase [Acidimicrobiales bacterium]